MKKIYMIPTVQVVELNGGALCESETIIIGSDYTDATRGDGTDLVKEDVNSRSSYNVWDDDWSKN